MAVAFNRELNERTLRWTLLLFFLALAIPAALLIGRAYEQIKWEVFHQYRATAEQLTERIAGDIRRLIEVEEQRSFGEYDYSAASPDGAANVVQQSPLAAYPVIENIPGVVGYFQVDSQGRLSSPVAPESGVNDAEYGLSEHEYLARIELRQRLREILNAPELGSTTLERTRPVKNDKQKIADDSASLQALGRSAELKTANVFDRLSRSLESSREKPLADYANVGELELDSRLDAKSRAQAPASQAALQRSQNLAKRESRKEQVPVYEFADEASVISPSQNDAARDADLAAQAERQPLTNLAAAPAQSPELRVRFFESEIGPFSLEVLDADHLVLFRNVWRAGERFIQGALVGRREFIERTIAVAFRSATVSTMSELLVAYDGDVVASYSAVPLTNLHRDSSEFRGELLYRSRLSAPASALELIYTVTDLPIGQGARYLGWLTLLLGLSLSGGCYVIYRYGIGQITLYRQQQDFVSAVSHELKTPLTSIRMYSEILKSGWASEEKKLGYYAFIHDESERLSRLIANVLQLSRMSRNNLSIELKPVTVGELLDVACAKISSQLNAAGFSLNVAADPEIREHEILIDIDAYTQIMINFIDNAIKFSPSDAHKQIDLRCRRQQDRAICFTVRDYGKGIQKNQMRKIFELFYRSENELTRETVGTGIGLALVNQLALAMNGSVDVRNCNPGAEFSLTFPPVGNG